MRKVTSILLVAVILLSGCATFMGTQLDRDIHRVQIGHGNCLQKALDIGAVRDKHNTCTTIVIAFALRHHVMTKNTAFYVNSATGWHAFWKDDKGTLQDITTEGTVLATPMFEFDYVKGMKRQVRYGAVHIYVDDHPIIVFACYRGEPSYRILAGTKYVRILRKSER